MRPEKFLEVGEPEFASSDVDPCLVLVGRNYNSRFPDCGRLLLIDRAGRTWFRMGAKLNGARLNHGCRRAGGVLIRHERPQAGKFNHLSHHDRHLPRRLLRHANAFSIKAIHLRVDGDAHGGGPAAQCMHDGPEGRQHHAGGLPTVPADDEADWSPSEYGARFGRVPGQVSVDFSGAIFVIAPRNSLR